MGESTVSDSIDKWINLFEVAILVLELIKFEFSFASSNLFVFADLL